jgi:hypothetical protein
VQNNKGVEMLKKCATFNNNLTNMESQEHFSKIEVEPRESSLKVLKVKLLNNSLLLLWGFTLSISGWR